MTAKSSENFTPNERAHLNKKFAFEIPKHAPYEYGFGHYVGLLALRKLFGKVIRARVRKEYGRESSDAEIAAIAEYYSGVRGRRLAEFGEAASNDPLAFAGEELLVTGAIFAILEGTDVVFLTRDPLFMDQFTELGRLLLGDYVACEFGRQYVQNPSGFPARVLPNDSSQPLEFFVGDVMAWRFKNGWQREILPRRPYPMNLHCWLLGRDEGDAVRFAALSVNVERPMHNLLRVKGATGGRNIDGLDGKNVRVGFENGVDTGVAMIGKERMVAVGKTEIPADDRLHLGVSSFAAADIAGLHSARDQIVAPWHENAS